MGEQNTQNFAEYEGKTMSTSSIKLRDVLTSQELYEAFVRNLRELRQKKGYKSANALAAMIPGLSPNTIRAWERLHLRGKERKGRTYPRLDALERVAERLNCEVWELFHPELDKLRRDLARLKRIDEAASEKE